jgi:hypothetical protein
MFQLKLKYAVLTLVIRYTNKIQKKNRYAIKPASTDEFIHLKIWYFTIKFVECRKLFNIQNKNNNFSEYSNNIKFIISLIV